MHGAQSEKPRYTDPDVSLLWNEWLTNLILRFVNEASYSTIVSWAIRQKRLHVQC